ncbi:MAG: ABC transporter ATP-binding protein [Ignavibacteriales bacterium]
MLQLYRFLKPYRLSVAAVFALVFLLTMSELYLPTLMADIVDIGIVNRDVGYIVRIGGWMLVIAGLGTICSVSVSYLAARNAVGLGKILRQQVFTKVESFSLHEIDKFGTATLITRTTNDINQVQTVTFMIQRMMIMAPIMCIGGIIMAVSQDRHLSLIFMMVIPILAAIIGLVMSKAIPLFRLMQLKIDKLNLVVREGLTGIRVIRAFNRIDRESVRFEEANADLMQNAIKVNRLMATLMPTMILVMNFTLIAIIWFGSVRIDRGQMQVGALMAFIQYSMQIMISLIMVSFMFIMVPRASASAVRINEVLNTETEIQDPQIHKQNEPSRGVVEFKDVTFIFPGAEQPAISNISFTARPGQITAIIGGTGSGKSALVSLIPRFYDVDEGVVLIDGIDVKAMTQENLRSQIGLVPQKTVLFTGTIADNIRFGQAEASDEEVRKAAETAQALEFIQEMKDGFDSVIEQGGINVSGGQKQRLSIARALVRGAKIYIFDDSFSALDFKTDARLRAALRRETTGSSVLIVGQRVAAVMDADQIIVLEEGRIAGLGNHRELMESCEVYREIVYSQLSEEELA